MLNLINFLSWKKIFSVVFSDFDCLLPSVCHTCIMYSITWLIIIYQICYDISRSEFVECKAYSTERETNTKGNMRAGQNMVQVRIINIFKGMIGTGSQIHHTEIGLIILGKLVVTMQLPRCRITTRSLVLTGMDIDAERWILIFLKKQIS